MPLNMDRVKSRAREAAQREKWSEGGDLRWYQWSRDQTGNIIRFLPPDRKVTDAEGNEQVQVCIPNSEFALVHHKHQRIPGIIDRNNAKAVDVQATYPDLGLVDPISEAIKELRNVLYKNGITKRNTPEQFNKVMQGYYVLRRGYTNVVDRNSKTFIDIRNSQVVTLDSTAKAEAHHAPAPFIIGLPLGDVNYWVVNQMDSGILPDVTDPVNGYDIVVQLIAPRGKNEFTRYSCNTVPDKRPLHADPAITQKVLENMYDLSQIFKAPNDAEMDRIKGIAQMVREYTRDLSSTSVQVPSPSTEHEAAAAGGGSYDGTPANPTQGAVAMPTKPDGSPDCFFNHIDGLPKCAPCPFETVCRAESEKIGKSLEARQEFHQAAA